MSDLIPENDKQAFKNAYADFFDTFKKEITVHKEAKKVVSQINTGFLYGYGDVSNQVNYVYQTDSQTFSAIVWYPKKGSGGFEIGGEIRAFIPEGEILIKVGEEAKTYLTSGLSVEKIDILNHSYELVGQEEEINHFFTGYYIFNLKETK